MPPRHFPSWTKTRTAKLPAKKCAPRSIVETSAITAQANAPVVIAPVVDLIVPTVPIAPVVDLIVLNVPISAPAGTVLDVPRLGLIVPRIGARTLKG